MTPTLAAGTFIADRYQLERPLGQGGMGSVWLARHLALDAPVAIKFVHLEGDTERLRGRFAREAKLAASVRHRNVVSITDYGQLPDGTAYMVMDYLEGESFGAFVASKPAPEEIVHAIGLALRGLVAVHDAGIIHRDLKPDNIFLVRDATGSYPKLIDFGISRSADPNASREKSVLTTVEGVIVGTPSYMSPEQARGLPDLDQRADIYAIGVILYEAFTGELPYDAPHIPDQLIKIVTGGAPHLHTLRPDLSKPLCDAVMKAMAREKSARFQNAREMLAALAPITGAFTGNFAGVVRSDRPPTRPGLPPAAKERESGTELTIGDTDAVPLPDDLLFNVGNAAPSSMPPAGVRKPRLGLWAAAAVALVLASVLAVWLGGSDGSASEPPSATQAPEASPHIATPAPQVATPTPLPALPPEQAPAAPAAETAGTSTDETSKPEAASRKPASTKPSAARPVPTKPPAPAEEKKKTRRSSARVVTELDY